jgi:tetratricopeptide (TPR) repeat protein
VSAHLRTLSHPPIALSSSFTSPQQTTAVKTTTNTLCQPFSAQTVNPNLDSSNLEQLKAEAIALEGDEQYEEALANYEKVLVIQQRDLPVGHLDTHETLTSIDRAIDQLKYASIENADVANSGLSLLERGKGDVSYRLLNKLIRDCW